MLSNIIGCASAIKPYNNGFPSSVTITSTDYESDCIQTPVPFPITVTRENSQRFRINMSFPNNHGYSVTFDNIQGVLQFNNSDDDYPAFIPELPYIGNISSCETNCGPNCNGLYIKDSLVVRLSLVAGNVSNHMMYAVDPNLFSPNDKYDVYLYTCDSQGKRGAAVNFIRNLGGLPVNNTTITNVSNNNTTILQSSSKCTTGKCHKLPKDICNKVRIPGIDISGQASTLSNGEDMGEVIFTIRDEFTYYDKEPIAHKGQCKIRYIEADKIKITRFKRCPELVSVLKGTGDTLLSKAQSLYDKLPETNTLTFPQFYENILYYAMVKYILSRILYGKFDVNFLLGKYNTKFLEDLGGSRFCGFITVFEDCQSAIYGYNKFFKSGKNHKYKDSM